MKIVISLLSKVADVIAITVCGRWQNHLFSCKLCLLMLSPWWKMLKPPRLCVSLADVIANVADGIATGQHLF